MNKSLKKIQNTMSVGQPIIQIVSFEEERVEKYLKQLANKVLKTDNVACWDSSNGIIINDKRVENTSDPLLGLNYVSRISEPGIFIFKDLNEYIRDSKQVLRKIRNIYQDFRNTGRFLILLSPDIYFHEMLKKEVEIIEYELPDFSELQSLLDRFLDKLQKNGKEIQLNETEKKGFITGALGLTYDEAYKAFKKAFQGRSIIDNKLLTVIHEEKKQLILKEGVLEYYSSKFTLKDLGGLDNLKDWLRKRENAFSNEASEFGLERPKGILAMGVSGCGKSLAAKIVASLWELPLFRLDMNLVYGGVSGAPEVVFARALKTMDSVAPAVLWIDEIESGITDKQRDGNASRILGYFLTWMQEHESEVFIAATANRIDLLPAELLRRGRFDQIFFLDLPARKAREEIFKIHLIKKGNSLEGFNIPQLAQITKGWSGSEIEQVIISAMYEAFNNKRKLNEDDLFMMFGSSVPLSTTMEEQIKRIRSWAHDRAVKGSLEVEY
jgi:SpoVK/Ycf46/Vps4 family AAA+-type ATPase